MINLIKRIWVFLLVKVYTRGNQIDDPFEKVNLKILNMKTQQGLLIESIAKIKAISDKNFMEGKNHKEVVKECFERLNMLKETNQYDDEDDNVDIQDSINKYENLKLETKKYIILNEVQDKKIEILTVRTNIFIDTITEYENELKSLKEQSKDTSLNNKNYNELPDFNFEWIDNQLSELENKIDIISDEAESWLSIGDELKIDDYKFFTEFSNNGILNY